MTPAEYLKDGVIYEQDHTAYNKAKIKGNGFVLILKPVKMEVLKMELELLHFITAAINEKLNRDKK